MIVDQNCLANLSFILMEDEEALPFSMPCQVDENVQDRGSRPLPVLEKACMMQGQASAEINIVDEIATNDSMQWQMNLQVKQDQQNDEEW